MKFSITIHFDVPDGTTFQVQPEAIGSGSSQFVPPFADELIPIAEAMPLPGDPVAFRAPQARQAETRTALCPIHHEPWKTVPAGISKKTGRPYDAFAACPVRGCDQRPAA